MAPSLAYRASLAVVALSLQALRAYAEEEGGEKEEVGGSMNAGVAAMLLGSIGFQMGTFYLVNHSDTDIRVHTWKVMCATISIFVSVLIYQAVNDVVKALFLEGAGPLVMLAGTFAHAAFWYVALQIFLAFVSGAVVLPCLPPAQVFTEEKEKKEAAETLDLNMKSWATILGHITGFAAISAWAQVQELLGGSFVAVLLAFGSLVILFRICDVVREKWSSLDGNIDEFERFWDAAAEETEDDVMCLTISFLVVQTLRYHVVGVLPSLEGNFPKNTYVNDYQCFVMLIFGISVGIFGYLRTILGLGTAWMTRRHATWVRLGTDFVLAWSLLFTTDAFLTNHGLGGNKMGCLGQVITAMILTIIGFLVVFLLDRQADAVEAKMVASPSKNQQQIDEYRERQKKAIRGTVLAIGVLIGFGWERCFDAAVDSTAEQDAKIVPPTLTKVGLALVLASIVLPAWRWYILPVVKELGGFEEEEEEEEEVDEEEQLRIGSPPLLMASAWSAGNTSQYVPPRPVPSPPPMAREQAELPATEVGSGALAGELEALRAQLLDQEQLAQKVAQLEAAKWKKKAEELAAQLQQQSVRLAELEKQQLNNGV